VIGLNRKVLVIAVALMAVAMLAIPVMAAPGGNKVPATCLTTYEKPVLPEDRWVNPGGITKSGIMHVGEFETYYGVLTIGTEEHFIYSYNVVPAVYNPGKGLYVSQSDAIWYVEPLAPSTPYPDPAFEQPTSDGFAGKVTMSLTNFAPPYDSIMIKVHVLMHGFGTFTGQTLEFSDSGSFTGFPILWEGFCIKG
jgi:hypothetical protein